MWNANGVEPRACQILQRVADASGNRKPVWKGYGLPTELQAAHLDRVLSDHRTLLERIPEVQDVQCAWVLTEASAMGHDEGLWRCKCEILRAVDTGVLARDTASLPLALIGFGLQSAVRPRASWADVALVTGVQFLWWKQRIAVGI